MEQEDHLSARPRYKVASIYPAEVFMSKTMNNYQLILTFSALPVEQQKTSPSGSNIVALKYTSVLH